MMDSSEKQSNIEIINQLVVPIIEQTLQLVFVVKTQHIVFVSFKGADHVIDFNRLQSQAEVQEIGITV